MAEATLRLPHMLAAFCEGAPTQRLRGETVAEALAQAMESYPLLRTHLMDEQGRVRPHIHVFLNEDDVRDQLASPLADGDEIVVLQAMSGGARG